MNKYMSAEEMTNEQALNGFETYCETCRKHCEELGAELVCSCCKVFVAKKAIEKQIPKKVLPDKEYYEGICPCCGVHFLDRSTNFCGNCGQALDWSEEIE